MASEKTNSSGTLSRLQFALLEQGETEEMNAETAMMRVCRLCKVEKPLSEFYPQRHMNDGRCSVCRECEKRRVKENRVQIKLRPKMPPERKVCPCCKKMKTKEEYCLTRSRTDGLSTYCKECLAVKNTEAYRKRPEKEPTVKHRVCPYCGIDKPASEFYRELKGKDGLSYECRTCRTIKTAEYYKKRRLTEPAVEHKVCPSCGMDKPAADFFRARKNKDGLNYECKKCNMMRCKQWTRDNPERYHELNRSKSARQVASGRMKIHRRNWAKKHPKYYREYYAKNIEKLRELERLKMLRRNTRKRELPFDLTEEDVVDIFEMFNNECAYCGSKSHLALEHVVPMKRSDVPNPGTVRGNLMVLCRQCNSSKGTRLLDEYFSDERNFRDEMKEFIKGSGLSTEEFLARIKSKLSMLGK